VSARFDHAYRIQKYEFGETYARREKLRLKLKKIGREKGLESAEYATASHRVNAELEEIGKKDEALAERVRELREENDRFKIVMTTVDGTMRRCRSRKSSAPTRLTSSVSATDCSVFLALGRVHHRRPARGEQRRRRVAAIVGTVIMTLLMSVAVVPFGVLAALYLREYAKAGPAVSAVRIAINNLAGVPSIVFGVFGLGFFCYIVGASIDEVFFAEKLPNPRSAKAE